MVYTWIKYYQTPPSLYPPSSLVRTLFGPRSELVRKTSEQAPNEVRMKED